MATRFIDKEYGADSSTAIANDTTGTAKVRNLPDAAGIVYDLVSNQLKYNANGTIKTILDTTTNAGGSQATSQTVTAASPTAPLYQTQSSLVFTPATDVTAGSSGSVAAVRGDITLSAGKTIDDGFFSGVNGKFIATTGTGVGATALRITGGFFKADYGTMAFTAGQYSGLWADVAGTPTGDLSEFYVLRVTNSGGALPNAMAFFAGNANYWVEVSNPGNNFILTAGTGAGSAGQAGGFAAAQVLKVFVGGAIRYIPLCSTNA